MLNKKFLKESPAYWGLGGIVIACTLLIISLLDSNWYPSALLVILLLWMYTSIQKDYTIWILTRRS